MAVTLRYRYLVGHCWPKGYINNSSIAPHIFGTVEASLWISPLHYNCNLCSECLILIGKSRDPWTYLPPPRHRWIRNVTAWSQDVHCYAWRGIAFRQTLPKLRQMPFGRSTPESPEQHHCSGISWARSMSPGSKNNWDARPEHAHFFQEPLSIILWSVLSFNGCSLVLPACATNHKRWATRLGPQAPVAPKDST